MTAISDARLIAELPSLTAIDRVYLSRDLREFVEAAWPVIEPTTPFVGGFHIDAICQHLQAVSDGRIRDLLITIPPRMMKSTIVSVMWPAWEWTARPSVRFLTASYADDLAMRDAVRTRRLIASPWYRARWGDRFAMSGDQNVKTRYENDKTGYRIATSVGGSATGEGGDRIVCDDPHNRREANSDKQRQGAIDWWRETMSTRLNDPKRSSRVVVQQRLHEHDLAGVLIEQGGYEHLNLPMEYEADAAHEPTSIGWRDPRSIDGQFLSPDRFSAEEKARALLDLGPWGYAGQYQQRPSPIEGGLMKRAAWQWWSKATLPTSFLRTAVFVDTASKKGQLNDFTAMAFWGETEHGWYLLDLLHDKLEFPELVATIQTLHAQWRPGEWVIEDTSNGTAAIQSLQASTRLPIATFNPGSDKTSRMLAAAPYQHARRLWLPEPREADFDVMDFVKEHADFPNGAHDDQCDTTSMMLIYWEINPPEVKDWLGPAVVGKARGWGYSR